MITKIKIIIGRLHCSLIGHRWRRLTPPGYYEGPNPFRKCRRCQLIVNRFDLI
jgi:hypothetical protein